ncbi:hypothetical protein CAPTEDRAFT_189400, partial [Capitella teleta]
KTSRPRATATSKRAAEPLSVQCVAVSADVGAAALCFRRTCISGLVVGIDAVIGLSEQLLTTGQMQFLLMYKFSQDHLELFFNAVRRFGGWNNNPSVNHFKAAFRALISRCRAAAVYGST